MTGKRSEQGKGRGRGPRGPILGMDCVATAGLTAVLAEQDAGAGIEEADMTLVPLHRDLAAEPSRTGQKQGRPLVQRTARQTG